MVIKANQKLDHNPVPKELGNVFVPAKYSISHINADIIIVQMIA